MNTTSSNTTSGKCGANVWFDCSVEGIVNFQDHPLWLPSNQLIRNHFLRRTTLLPCLYRINLAASELTISAITTAGLATSAATSLSTLLACFMRINLAMGEYTSADATIRFTSDGKAVFL